MERSSRRRAIYHRKKSSSPSRRIPSTSLCESRLTRRRLTNARNSCISWMPRSRTNTWSSWTRTTSPTDPPAARARRARGRPSRSSTWPSTLTRIPCSCNGRPTACGLNNWKPSSLPSPSRWQQRKLTTSSSNCRSEPRSSEKCVRSWNYAPTCAKKELRFRSLKEASRSLRSTGGCMTGKGEPTRFIRYASSAMAAIANCAFLPVF
mmetsp:Transcript_114282/g.272016  ORF Transcript_114282/g.272016 Transcript_114282/m.272016 type:complete len:207 (+) Transcript_114282:132-752(+)